MALDPEELTPLARKVMAARDDVLRTLSALGDDRKAMMALTYASATYISHLSQTTGKTHEACVAMLAEQIMQTLEDGVMTAPYEGESPDG